MKNLHLALLCCFCSMLQIGAFSLGVSTLVTVILAGLLVKVGSAQIDVFFEGATNLMTDEGRAKQLKRLILKNFAGYALFYVMFFLLFYWLCFDVFEFSRPYNVVDEEIYTLIFQNFYALSPDNNKVLFVLTSAHFSLVLLVLLIVFLSPKAYALAKAIYYDDAPASSADDDRNLKGKYSYHLHVFSYLGLLCPFVLYLWFFSILKADDITTFRVLIFGLASHLAAFTTFLSIFFFLAAAKSMGRKSSEAA